MESPRKPANESERLASLRSLDLLDTPAEQRFDAVTRTAKRLFDVPIALITLVDAERQWFKSRVGLEVGETPRSVSFCGHAILDEKPLIVPDARRDERFADNPLVLDEPHIRFYAGQPLRAPGGARIGTLCLIDRQPRTFGADERAALADLASIVEREIGALELAIRDDLTGLLNRRGFSLRAEQSLRLCTRQSWPAALMFLDCDDFKTVNDSFGHAEGDRALRAFAREIRASCRAADVLGRIGGDEFVILLFDADRAHAESIAERVRRALERLRTEDGHSYSLGFSHGVVEFDPDRPAGIERLLELGDELMYRAKRTSAKP